MRGQGCGFFAVEERGMFLLMALNEQTHNYP